MARRLLICFGFLLVALTGCGGENGVTNDVDSDQPAKTPTSTDAALTPGEPSTSGITGFAATRDVWNDNHEPVPGYDVGSAYLPLVNVNEGGQIKQQPKYAAVTATNSLITDYTVYFENGTGIDQAKAEILKEFPAGALESAALPKGRCLMTEISSELGQMVPSLGGGMHILVSYYSGSADFSDDAVKFAILSLKANAASEMSC